MIYPQTTLTVLDNSGVNTIKCIQVTRKHYKYFGSTGSLIKATVVSLKKTKKKSTLSVGDVVSALVVRTKKNKSSNGFYYSFYLNCAVLLSKSTPITQVQPLGSRISGPLLFYFKNKYYSKVLSLSKKLV